MEFGRIKQITTRDRIALEVGDRLVVAQIQSGGGGSIADEVEGPMSPASKRVATPRPGR